MKSILPKFLFFVLPCIGLWLAACGGGVIDVDSSQTPAKTSAGPGSSLAPSDEAPATDSSPAPSDETPATDSSPTPPNEAPEATSSPTSPSIASFTASATSVAPGVTVSLTAVFTNGTGSVDHNVGAVSSGVAKKITLNATTTFTLTVTNGVATDQETKTVAVVSTSASDHDRFGITMLHPTTTGGREWFNKWDTGPEREYTCDTRKQDAVDPEQLYNGDGTYHIYGSTGAYPGQMLLYGMEPRIYVRPSTDDDPKAGTPKWKNVEVTFYGKTTSYNTTTEEWTWAGLEAVVRTDHWPFDEEHDCSTAGYGGRVLFNGLMDFEKEVSHNQDSNKQTRQVTNGSKQYWPASTGMPMNTWIGFKLIARSTSNDMKVRLELYLDMSDGANGGNWQGPIISFDDYSGWSSDMPTGCDSRPAGAVLGANYTVYLRTDALDRKNKDMQYYKHFSVREIDPLP